MNTGQRNTSGRVIYRGPRGGEYVLGSGGRKIRSFTRATAPAAAPVAAAPAPAAAVPGNRNILGRVIHRGSASDLLAQPALLDSLLGIAVPKD